MLLPTGALAVEPVTVVALRSVMEAARGLVVAAVVVATVAVRGLEIVVALGQASVAVRGGPDFSMASRPKMGPESFTKTASLV